MLLATAVLLFGGTPAEHPAAMSNLIVSIEEDRVSLRLRFQSLTLEEVPHLQLDQDGDGWLTDVELRAQWPQVAPLFAEGLRIEIDGVLREVEWRIEGFENQAPFGDRNAFEYCVLSAELLLDSAPKRIDLHADIFLADGNPGHLLNVVVAGLGNEREVHVLDEQIRDARLDVPSGGSLLQRYLRLGWGHVLEGWDHLAFLLALLVGVAGLRALLYAVTAFTVAHSITLGLSALDVFSLPGGLVEPGIALSVLLVLVWHLRRGASAVKPWIPAFAFGLLHGFGFAGVLGETGLPAVHQGWALLGFNLGVEAGQLSFAVPVALLVLLFRRTPERIRETASELALLGLTSFALHLVGGAVVSWWIHGPSFLGEPLQPLPWVILAAAILAPLPGGDPDRRIRTRRLLTQGAILVACYSAGAAWTG